MLEIIKKDIINSFLNYLHLYSWLDLRFHKIITKRNFSFSSVEKFWNMVKNEELKHGDIIKIKEGFLTEWIPKIPGQAWRSLPKESEHYKCLKSLRCGNMFSSGSLFNYEPSTLGVVRLPHGKDSLNFATLSITTHDCWSVDLSIPIIVSKEVYYQFVKTKNNNKSVEGDIEARLEFGELPLFDNTLIKAFGADLNDEFIKQFSTPLTIPKVYLRLSSPLNVKLRTHNSHPPGAIWVLSRNLQSHQIHHIINGDKTTKIEIKPCKPYEFIGLELAHIDLSDNEMIEHYVNAFKRGNCIPAELFPDIKFVDNPGKEITILTEFDAQKRYFNNIIPISNKVWENSEIKQKIITTLKLLNA